MSSSVSKAARLSLGQPLFLAVIASAGCVSLDWATSLGASNCTLANCNGLVGVYDHYMKRGEHRAVVIAKPDNSRLPVWTWESSANAVVRVESEPCKGRVACIQLVASSPGTATVTATILEKQREQYPVSMRSFSFTVQVAP